MAGGIWLVSCKSEKIPI